jgi:hypothetical protein
LKYHPFHRQIVSLVGKQMRELCGTRR